MNRLMTGLVTGLMNCLATWPVTWPVTRLATWLVTGLVRPAFALPRGTGRVPRLTGQSKGASTVQVFDRPAGS